MKLANTPRGPAVDKVIQELRDASIAADWLIAERDELKRRLDKLLELLHDRSDVVDGEDGPRPNQAMSILIEFEGWERGWTK